jgi:hypothetical protein
VTRTFIPLLLALAAFAAEPQPLFHAHAHNDYLHARPLRDALDHGFCSVEADVWLVDGRLLVAHDRAQVKPERTLEALYLDPLRERVARNGGRVHRGGPSLTLLIDFKSDATNTYRALRELLPRYAAMLTRFHADRTETNAVTVVLSGNRPRGWLAVETNRLAACDGRLADLDTPASPHFMPLVSDNWRLHFQWCGTGPFPEGERRRLAELARQTHAQGKQLRLWATPDLPAVWSELLAAGVDWINTDDLTGLQEFSTKRGNKP